MTNTYWSEMLGASEACALEDAIAKSAADRLRQYLADTSARRTQQHAK